jgi:hypothetical protein
MKSTVSRLFHFVASLAFVALLAAPAYAGQHDRDDDKDDKHDNNPPASHSAPEIDPAGLSAIGALLIGGSLLLKSRRNPRVSNN